MLSAIKMKANSSLSIDNFRGKLKESVTHGNPIIMGSPFAVNRIFSNTSKHFFGEFNDNSFAITKNISWFSPLPVPFVIKGAYTFEDNLQTKLTYEIKPLWFGYLWMRAVPISAFIIFNIMFLRENNPFPPTVIWFSIFPF